MWAVSTGLFVIFATHCAVLLPGDHFRNDRHRWRSTNAGRCAGRRIRNARVPGVWQSRRFDSKYEGAGASVQWVAVGVGDSARHTCPAGLDLFRQRGRVHRRKAGQAGGEPRREGVSGRLVGPAAFKAVVGSFARPRVGSIPIHSRHFLEFIEG